MSVNKKISPKKKLPAKRKEAPVAVLGRKRDQALATNIIEAAIEVLAEVGFDSMTMDMVAARAKAGKASLYRRWSSKAELVRDAVILMSHDSVQLDKVPDFGSLRDDLFSLHKPYSAEHSNRKMKILSGLGSFFSEHAEIAQEAISEIFDPMIKMQLLLMKRAIERKEISIHADIEMASQVIIAMVSYYTRIQNQPFDRVHYAGLLDQIIIPALKNPPSKSIKR